MFIGAKCIHQKHSIIISPGRTSSHVKTLPQFIFIFFSYFFSFFFFHHSTLMLRITRSEKMRHQCNLFFFLSDLPRLFISIHWEAQSGGRVESQEKKREQNKRLNGAISMKCCSCLRSWSNFVVLLRGNMHYKLT